MEITLNEKEYLKKTTEYTGVNPLKFGLWIGMASMTMFFAALTSALLIKKGDFRVWESFKMPNIFMYSTAAVVSVSVIMQFALVSYKNAKFAIFRALLFTGFLGGCLFLVLQLAGWHALKEM